MKEAHSDSPLTELQSLRRANEQLARENEELNALFVSGDVSLVLLDREQRVRRFLPREDPLLHLIESDIGRPFSEIPTNFETRELAAPITRALETGRDQELELRDLDGRTYRVHVRARFAGLEVSAVQLTFVDVHTLARRVSVAKRATADAEQLSRIKDDFLSILSHELRTPIASVLMHTQLLRQGQLDAAASARALQAIERGTRKQVELIDDLLDATRIVTNQLHLENRAFDLCGVVRSAIDGVSELGRRKTVALEVVLDESIGQVWGDPRRVQKVVTNLLTNAIKFTPAGGRVLLELSIEDGNACLRVCDDGIGIEPERLPHLFDRLMHRDGEAGRAQGGLGLGLALVRHIVEQLGGTVHAESDGLGHGATFTVTFPLTGYGRTSLDRLEERSVHPLDRPGRIADYGELQNLPVLVVDDDPGTLEAIVSVLRLSGADVRSAASAAEAGRVLDDFAPKVLVCDIAMPEEDGHAFIRRLRSSDAEHGGDVLALALTALSGDDDRRRALAAGFHSHMAKPVDVDRLRDAVVGLLRD